MSKLIITTTFFIHLRFLHLFVVCAGRILFLHNRMIAKVLSFVLASRYLSVSVRAFVGRSARESLSSKMESMKKGRTTVHNLLPIGWSVCPHRWVGPWVFPASSFCRRIFREIVDVIARTILSPYFSHWPPSPQAKGALSATLILTELLTTFNYSES